MADKENGEDILRAILEKGSDKAKKAAADALTQHPPTPADPPEVKAKKRRKGLKKAIAAYKPVAELNFSSFSSSSSSSSSSSLALKLLLLLLENSNQ